MDQAKLVIRRKTTCSLPAGNRGGIGWPSWAHPRTPARLRVGGLGMAADPWKQAAGEPGASRRGRSTGSNPVACDRKRIEMWPVQVPPPRQQDRLLASRGSCGQTNGIGPRGTRSARGDHRQWLGNGHSRLGCGQGGLGNGLVMTNGGLVMATEGLGIAFYGQGGLGNGLVMPRAALVMAWPVKRS